MKKSKLGYKRYSPDVRKPYNVIPSGRITMRDVDFPVYGVDDMGNAQMMYPGGEYQFPGNQVFELPMAQVGGQRDTIYTSNPNDPRLKAYQDSLYVRALNPQTFRPGNRTRPLTLDEKIFWKDEKTGLVPNLVEYDPDQPTDSYFGHYKKPVQPVEYREVSKVIVKPKELLQDTNSSKLKVKRTPRLPESIDSIKQDASGVNVYVTVNGKTSVIPKKDYPLWRAENKDLYDAYTVKRAYGGEQLLMAQVGTGVPQPVIRPNFFTPEQIRQARIDAAKKAPLTFEGRINEALGNPKERAADLSQKVAPKGEGPVDNIRHTVAGMYTADAIANKLSPYAIGPTAVVPKIAGFMGSNLAGLAHEVKAFIPSLEGNYRNIPATARMSAEDMINNFVGSALSLNPFMNEKEKEDLIVKMSYENYLPDGYAQIHPNHSKDLYFKKEYGGDLEEFGSGGLKQWFAEKWVDVKTGKECGRSGKDRDGRPYPACRPSRRVNSTTPKTTSEMSSSEKAKFKSVKTSGQRISYNHKRRQRGGQMSGSLGYDSMYGSPIAAFRYMMNPKDESKYYGEVYGTKQGPGIAAGLDYDNQKYGTQGMIRLGADPLRGASIRAQGGKRFNPIDNRTEDLSWGPYGGVNFQTNDYTEFTGTGNQLGYNNLRPRLTAGVNAQYDRELANRGRFSVEGDLGIGVGNRYGNMGEFQPEPYGAIKATYSPPMYKNTRGKNNTKNKRPSPTTYSPRGYQLGGPTSAFIPLMVAAQAKLSSLFGSDESTSKSAPKPVDWTQMKRPDQIKYGIDQIVALEPEDRRKSLENLLEATAYMENRYGADPRAYGRSYTSSFMSIDPIALKDMFTGRGNKGNYNAAQRAQMENFKRLNLPTDQKQFDSRLRKDDPVAAMAAARYRYAMSPQALPDPNNPQQMFDYWLTNYNGKGVLKHQTRDQAYKEFLKGYKMAVGND